MLKKNSQPGFTLIEMLIVIAIIGILAGTIMASLSSTRRTARDRRRVSDIQLISGALQAYVRDGNTVKRPSQYGEESGECLSRWDCSFQDVDVDTIFFVDYLQASPGECTESSCPYLTQDPRDPLHNSKDNYYKDNYYMYRAYNQKLPGEKTEGCPEPFYVLIAVLETDGLTAAQNDQSCWTGTNPANTDSSYFVIGR